MVRELPFPTQITIVAVKWGDAINHPPLKYGTVFVPTQLWT